MSLHVKSAVRQVERSLEELGAKARHQLGVKLEGMLETHRNQIVKTVSSVLAKEAGRVVPPGIPTIIEAELGESVDDAIAHAVSQVTDAAGAAIRKAFGLPPMAKASK